MLFPRLQVQDVDLLPASGRYTDLEKLAGLVTTNVDDNLRPLFRRSLPIPAHARGEGTASITVTRAPIREKNRSKLLPTAFSFLRLPEAVGIVFQRK